MSDETNQAHADLAFLRGLTQTGGRPQMMFGLVYALSGVLYGTHAFIGWLQIVRVVALSQDQNFWLTVVVNGLFAVLLAWSIWAGRKQKMDGVVTRAVNAAFAGVGLANIAMVFVFGWASYQAKDAQIWLIYPSVVFAFQGAAWFIAYMLRKHVWLLAVALGWFGAAVVLGFFWRTPTWVLAASLSLYLLMTVPGLVMVRLSRRAG